MLVKDAQTVSAYSWSAGENQWKKIGELVDAAGGVDPSKRVKYTDGKEYDYIFDVDIEDGKPPLKLPYNVSGRCVSIQRSQPNIAQKTRILQHSVSWKGTCSLLRIWTRL